MPHEAIARARKVSEVLSWGLGMVQPALRAAVDGLPAAVRRVAGYHLGWWDEHGEPTDAAGGKAIRPVLALLAAEAVGGAATAAVPAATAVELVHNFTLLHDDVLDGDRTRRHRPAAWHVFGVRDAILTGDALLALAFDVLAAGGHPAALDGVRTLNATVLGLVDGEHADLAFEDRHDISVAECVAMAERKTAGLLACACALGASFAGAEPAAVAGLRDFGLHLGVAFQHVDDLLGIWGDPAVTGKPVHGDLRARKKSLPVVAALNSDTAAGRELAALYEGDGHRIAAEPARAARLIEAAGGRSWSEQQAELLLTQALHKLDSVNPRPRAAAELTDLARTIVHRDR
ncbi:MULTISPECIES: family 2 encapsulin nanocompartment cargo protein polyprenyl transferase [Saccharothrix]|uniref:family 2 encapsulin nanocompartment cargo protein polyprenyl transferase n=1 Tax=Saccharothrix TaxID=2071 RepID=UPI00093C0F0A|nr:family 2 encapsulin nanocompartment cargo protein polyprenyl transferase [Saccharothrix sp. CB00851]OKI16212.1 dimethylallyltranstransferase [Saccharothrix sp. CB00851]